MAAESVSSGWPEGSQNGFTKEEASESSADIEPMEDFTIHVTVHVEEDEYVTENGNAAVVTRNEDSDLAEEGCEVPHSVTHPPSPTKSTSSECTDLQSSSCGLIPTADPCIKLEHSPSQLEDCSSGRQNNSAYQVPSDGVQDTNQLTVEMRENQYQLCENVEKLDTVESNYDHEKSPRCDVCEKNFSCEVLCNNHQKVCKAEKHFKCPFCERVFRSKWNCKRHEMIHTGIKKSFKCQVCGMSFREKWYCKAHERSHSSDKPFKCQLCEKSFILKLDCERHETTHTGEKPFKCQFCEKSFSRVQNCKRHEMGHTGQKPFQCHFCEKSFIQKNDRERHELTHTGEKLFKCQFCGKCFNRKDRCKAHEMAHTGTKPFKCQFCEKSFHFKHNCKTHEIKHCMGVKTFVSAL